LFTFSYQSEIIFLEVRKKMKVQNKNHSSLKTKMKIQESFAMLLQEKNEIKNISVTELSKRADITRSAFYTHYSSIYDVAKELEEEALEKLNEIKSKHSIEDIDYYFDHIFNYLKENERIYTMMLKSNDPLLFVSKLEKSINKKLYDALKNKPIANLNLNITFFTNGCINLIIKYFRKEIKNSLEEIDDYIKHLFKTFFI
jgi:AcrR family transcriptional regulator